ncbi:class I SAM-dependent methyltransferase [Bradyrhizobium sp. ARR65]|uniref:class I SAM-dependent methyltransferase n=1 Tax=Bradyrhizobium sp. ARR65 TaxID=1040989 RepID=UPI0018DD483A|nr:class I SAM-dependent methyltransferase [Bradyrhizobium sp. ARR65]
MFSTAPAANAMSCLVSGLCDLRERLDADKWRLLRSEWMHHPLARVVHQDPLTSWSYRKPRGYPGDARLLDFIYGEANIAAHVSSATRLGREIYGFTSEMACSAAIRERRGVIAKLVDRVAHERGRQISVLSIGAGHLREAAQSRALAEGNVARWMAVDQDKEALAYLARTFAELPIRRVGGSVTGLIAGQHELGSFDVIYAAGLYDHLSDRVAKRLTETAFAMLRPGGELLFANFARGIHDAGYMETFMDWRLLFRDESKVEEIWSDLPRQAIASRRLFMDANRNVIYGLVQRT